MVTGSASPSTASNDLSINGHYEVSMDHLNSDSQNFWPSPNTMEALFTDEIQGHPQVLLTPSLSAKVPVTSMPSPAIHQGNNHQYFTEVDFGTCGAEPDPTSTSAIPTDQCHLQLSRLHIRLIQQLESSAKEAPNLSEITNRESVVENNTKSFGNALGIASELSNILQCTVLNDEASDASDHTEKHANRHVSPGNATLPSFSDDRETAGPSSPIPDLGLPARLCGWITWRRLKQPFPAGIDD
ncbi:hypothetical protein KCU89_g713, partial [Aureobasidium melanogenum]